MDGVGGEFGEFISRLTSNWVSRNYHGIKEAIESRLAVKTNDWPALIAKADYYTTISVDMAIVSNIVLKSRAIKPALNWATNKMAEASLEAMIHSWRSQRSAQGLGTFTD